MCKKIKNVITNIVKRFNKNAFISALITIGLTYIITDALNLSNIIKYLLMIIMCIVSSIVVTLKPKLILYFVCITLFIMGVFMILISYNKELIEQITWDPNLLSAGASILSISIALYALIDLEQQGMQQKTNVIDIDRKKVDALKGYLWQQNEERFICNYCLNNGKYKYYKTNNGIQNHITKAHEK